MLLFQEDFKIINNSHYKIINKATLIIKYYKIDKHKTK